MVIRNYLDSEEKGNHNLEIKFAFVPTLRELVNFGNEFVHQHIVLVLS